jgi:hypothetical protein
MTTVSVPDWQPLSGNSGIDYTQGDQTGYDPISIDIDPAPVLFSHLVGVPYTIQLTQNENETGKGKYFDIGGEVQALPGRPIQGRGSFPVGYEGFELRGALLLSADFQDLEPFDPVISRPVSDTFTTA